LIQGKVEKLYIQSEKINIKIETKHYKRNSSYEEKVYRALRNQRHNMTFRAELKKFIVEIGGHG